MTVWLVTVKDEKNPDHDPRNKQMGPCKWSPVCTDVTGQHHTLLVHSEFFTDSTSIEDQLALIEQHYQERNIHITRIEAVL